MELRTDYGSIPHMPKHDIRSRQTICHGGNGSRVRAEKARKSQPKSDGRGRGTVVCDSVFRPAGGMQPLDHADDSGRIDAAGSGGLYNGQYGVRSDEKNELKPWKVEEWCIPTASADFVARMEDVLDVYERPYDPIRPVVCIDETNKQLVQETRIPREPGQPEKVDSEYEKKGVADVFMIFEPLAGKRDTIVTRTRTAVDFAQVLRHTSDVLYPHAEKIVLVTDNLNTHTPASLYKAFPPDQARRLAERFEWHYTPKHGSWLDMAEIEISIMSRQALAKPLPDFDSFVHQVRSWTLRRNASGGKVSWQFRSADARIKLARLYPPLV